jgi:hypothetical protein
MAAAHVLCIQPEALLSILAGTILRTRVSLGFAQLLCLPLLLYLTLLLLLSFSLVVGFRFAQLYNFFSVLLAFSRLLRYDCARALPQIERVHDLLLNLCYRR